MNINEELKSVVNMLNYLREVDNLILDINKDRNLSRLELIERYLMLVKIINFKLKNIELMNNIKCKDDNSEVNGIVNILVSLNDGEREELKKFLINLKKSSIKNNLEIGKVIYD